MPGGGEATGGATVGGAAGIGGEGGIPAPVVDSKAELNELGKPVAGLMLVIAGGETAEVIAGLGVAEIGGVGACDAA